MKAEITFALLASGYGCAGETHQSAAPAAAAEAPQDSLVSRGPGGRSVWFTLAREDHSAAGEPCVDRAIEIRSASAAVPVPLLYTERAPRFIDDSTLEATLFRGCRPVDRYRVDVRTGQPKPIR